MLSRGYQTFIENNMFLCSHKAIEFFVAEYLRMPKRSYAVVCERKEDVIAVRNQIYFEIEKQSQKSIPALCGISIFTLDHLGRNFCATMANTSHPDLKALIPASLFEPYLDVHTQEALIQLILNLCGYTQNDSLALAKQILTLLDTPLPPETNLVELILSTQETDQNKLPSKQIHTHSLTQILATFQQAKIELSSYARFQTLVQDYFNGYLGKQLDDPSLKSHWMFPKNILKSAMLWVQAPYYQGNKPGHYQRTIVDDFKWGILKIRQALGFDTTSFFLDSKTVLDNPDAVTKNPLSCHFLFSENDNDFFQKTVSLKSNESHFVLLADFNPNEYFCTIRSDACVTYELHKNDLQRWACDTLEPTDIDHELFLQIDGIFDEFIATMALMKNWESFKHIAGIYQIPTDFMDNKNTFKLFEHIATKKQIMIGVPHPASELPKALSFFCSSQLPDSITVLGRVHAPVSSSFNVKMLNHTILLLRDRGVEIELPASDLMYKEFWKHLVATNPRIEFWLPSKSTLEDFPKYFIPCHHIRALNQTMPPLPNGHLVQDYMEKKLEKPHWQTDFSWKKNRISVTQLECYVHCPLQFFLNHVLNLKKDSADEFEINHMDVGSRMHKICEQLITRMVTLFGNEEYLIQTKPIYEALIAVLKDQNVFLSFEKDSFEKSIHNAIFALSQFTQENRQSIAMAFCEAIDTIWTVEPTDDKKSRLVQWQEREILKRCFLKFLQTECACAVDQKKKKIGIAREFPLSFCLEDFQITAKIDRVDVCHDGVEIIDYKTSKIPAVEKELTLLPSRAKADVKLRLSAQGALYSYGWVQLDPLSAQAEQNPDFDLRSFSLYRLKNLDPLANPILKFSFPHTAQDRQDFLQQIHQEYSAFVRSLEQGLFHPQPLQGVVTCRLCPYTDLCPWFLSQQNPLTDQPEDPS